MSVKQTEEKITVLYERLSRDDDLAGESNSIVQAAKRACCLCKAGGKPFNLATIFGSIIMPMAQ